ncbi:metal-dependent transcriptional regulator [Levilactobacillus enshiensis]|uniref:metal-dependent transcriptional regulator n=1 Tax=Levilactobacillus enshiensis TaxID=2590213 RepID=UPI00117B4A64|nr:metal-dependent transcriptional regulator [Levilactobacillus enshiensis]
MLNHQNSYLKIIAECSFARPRVSNKQIIHFANVSPATVTETTRILQQKGLVDRHRYTGVTLTALGEKLACQLLYNYRLCEVFLAEHLRLPLNEVPTQAWGVAANLTPTTAAALNDYLDHPQQSPFGGTLDTTQMLADTHVTRLSDVTAPATITLNSYLETTGLIDYLQHLQLPLGVTLSVRKRDSALNLIYLETAQQREITVNLNAADYIYTTPAEIPASQSLVANQVSTN